MNTTAIPGLSPREKLIADQRRFRNKRGWLPKSQQLCRLPDWVADLEIISEEVRAAIYNHCGHLSDKGKGKLAQRREAHYALFHAVNDYIEKAAQALIHNALCQQQDIPKWLQCPTTALEDEGLRLKWRIDAFVKGKAKHCKGRRRPRGATRNLLSDRCVPMIEELIDLAQKKTPA